MPATEAVASSWVALSGVPEVMGEGADHVMVGVALLTVSETLAEAELYLVASVGVKVTERLCVPAVSIVVAGGV